MADRRESPVGGSTRRGRASLSAALLGAALVGSLSGLGGFAGRAHAGTRAQGYWMVATDGGIFSYGDAGFYGSTGAIKLNQPIVGMASTPSGRGYWLVATDGGIFSYGDAGFYGSTGAIKLNQPIVGMASTPSGRGYWLVARDGGIFSYGDAGFYGSTGAIKLNQPIVGMASTPSGRGYWLVARDGGIFSYGDAGFYGSTGAATLLGAPVSGIAVSPTGRGYWLVAENGRVFAAGDSDRFAPRSSSLAPAVAGIAALPAGPEAGATAVSQTTTAPPAATAPPPTTTTPPPPSAAPVRQRFEVGLVGDTGYTAGQERDLLDVRDDMAPYPLAFVVHNGDIWEGGTPCTEESFEERRAIFDSFAHPFLYTPGDNDWTDCPSGSPGGNLSTIREVFFSTDESLGRRRIQVTRQHPTFVENARWWREGVAFATFNVPGPDGGGGDSKRRNAANLKWLHETFDLAEANGSPGVMVIWQDNPFEPSRGSALLDALEERTRAFGRPVVLVHGDTHRFRIDRPLHALANFIRVETFAGGDADRWVRAVVDPSSPEVFTFLKMRA